MDSAELGRRVRAARAYAGYDLDGLAEAAEIGRTTLIRTEKGERPTKNRELRAIAAACGIPIEFFTARTLGAPENSDDAAGRYQSVMDCLRQLDVKLDGLSESQIARMQSIAVGASHDVAERIDELTQLVARLLAESAVEAAHRTVRELPRDEASPGATGPRSAEH